MIVLWVWIAGMSFAWYPIARYLIRDFTDDGRCDVDVEDVALAGIVAVLFAMGWPALVVWAVVRPWIRQVVARINAGGGS